MPFESRGQDEDVVDQAQHSMRVVVNDSEELFGGVLVKGHAVVDRHEHRIDEALNGRQRRAQVMRDDRDEGVLHLLLFAHGGEVLEDDDGAGKAIVALAGVVENGVDLNAVDARFPFALLIRCLDGDLGATRFLVPEHLLDKLGEEGCALLEDFLIVLADVLAADPEALHLAVGFEEHALGADRQHTDAHALDGVGDRPLKLVSDGVELGVSDQLGCLPAKDEQDLLIMRVELALALVERV